MSEHKPYIELPKPVNTDKEEIHKLRTALKDVRYIFARYGKENPHEALECISKIVNDPKLRTKGGKH
jgi:CHAD domain-containing protein